mgnify:CR=1 FL=1
MSNFLVDRRNIILAETENLIYERYNIVCDGTNCFDTGFAPFSSGNINKDFKISIRLSSFTSTGNSNQDAIVACKYEDGALNGLNWPGFTIRKKSNGATTLEVGGNNYWTPTVSSVLNKHLYIWRTSGNYYGQIEGGTQQTLNVRSTTFDHHILIGATQNANGTKMRNSKGNIDYIKIEYM